MQTTAISHHIAIFTKKMKNVDGRELWSFAVEMIKTKMENLQEAP
jgi:hypothetical protein